MKLVENQKIIHNLNKLIKECKLPKPDKVEMTSFDVEYCSFKIQLNDADLVIHAEKMTDIERRQQFYAWNTSNNSSEQFYSYNILINDPNFMILNPKNSKNILIEKNTRLTQRVFNRLSKYHRSGR